ncbi:hypothetical protein [Vibrio jasicida]|uniref:hypothetical protein n=1 Tax=Vibrio jasicida TaxID=766224 RepID=UPI0005EFA026|nr:hypothetical protein [Vibrio jasicida]
MFNLSKTTLVTLGSISSIFPVSLAAMNLEVNPVGHNQLVGKNDGEVVINYSKEGYYQAFYWELLSNQEGASKFGENEAQIDITELPIDAHAVRFCLEGGSTPSVSCSAWYSAKSSGYLDVAGINGGALTIDFENKGALHVGTYLKASAKFLSEGSELDFSNMTLVIFNQDDERLAYRISRSQDAIINTFSPLGEESTSVKACATVEYTSGDVSDTICTPLYSTAVKERYQGVSIHTGNETIDLYDRSYKSNYVISILN